MKRITLRILLVFFVALLFEGCSSNSSIRPTYSLPTAQPKTSQESGPTKEIFLTYGGYDKPLTKLGQVEYKLKASSPPDDTYKHWDQAIESLKQAALRRFGDKLDAIINVEIVESTEWGIGEQYHMIHAKGLAISFSPGARPAIKPKTKHKAKPPSKAITTNKPKPSNEKKPPEKPQPEEEIEITPSELLK
jgi:hypothetical protein